METRRTNHACCTRLVNFAVTLGGGRVLENINLHMHCGELTAVIGPNGGGKTTLLRAIVGELPHDGLLQFIHGDRSENARLLRTGYVPQKLDLDAGAPTTVLDLFTGATTRWPVWLGAPRRVRAQARERLSVVGAEHLLDNRLGGLSGGELQRVLLALALAPAPELLLLDEPVSGVDQAGMTMFYQMVSKLRERYDLAILLVTHDLLAAARVADRMLVVNRTILLDGRPRDVLSDPLMKQLFGFSIAEPELPLPVSSSISHHENCTCPEEER